MPAIELTTAALIAIGTTALGGGVAWGTRGAQVKNVKEDVVEIKADFKEHEAEDRVIHTEIVDRLARIETKIDAL